MSDRRNGITEMMHNLSESKLECQKLRLELGILQAQLGLSIKAVDKMRNRLRLISKITEEADDCDHVTDDPNCAWCTIRELVEPWRATE